MSLDVSLVDKSSIATVGTGVFVRRDGQNVELTLEDVREKWPDAEVSEKVDETNEVFEYNITHNLTDMAAAAGLYKALWRPEESGWKHAKDITQMLEAGLAKLKAEPSKYEAMNPANGWGSYAGLVEFVEQYLAACRKYPEAEIRVSR